MRSIVAPALGALVLLGACNGEPATSPDTMALLRSGDGRLCVDNNVEETLRSLIRPKNFEAVGYSINFSATSLQSFDREVAKAVCSTSVSVVGPEGSVVDDELLNFDVAPDARDQRNFIIAARVADISARLAAAADSASAVAAAQEARNAEHSRMAALVKPGWLIGRWVEEERGSDACLGGPFLEFARGNLLTSADGAGSWRLVDGRLQMISASQSSTVEITEADEMNFGYDGEDGASARYRRCTPDDARLAKPEAEATTRTVEEPIEESGNAY